MGTPTKTLTFETRLDLIHEQDAALCQYAELWNQVKFRWFANLQKPKAQQLNRTQFMHEMGMPFSYRVFQGVRQNIKGLIQSYQTNRNNRLVTLDVKIKQLEKTLNKLKKRCDHVAEKGCPQQAKKLRNTLRQKEVKLRRWQQKQAALVAEKQENKTPICFGGRKLLKERQTLKSNEGVRDWQCRWHEARHREFLLVGSHDESWGCQNAQLSPSEQEDAYQLKLLVPHQLRATFGTTINIDHLQFKHGKAAIAQAVWQNQVKKHDKSIKGQPLSFRFKRDKKGWRLLVSVEVAGPTEQAEWIDDDQGVIGVDVNPDHLAVVELDRNGNPLQHRTFDLPLHYKNDAQRAAIIGDAVRDLMDFAAQQGKAVVIEKLDFQQKKRQYQKQDHPQYARMLNAFAYGKIKDLLETQSIKRGIRLYHVNPAYTSLLGRMKYRDRHGFSDHHAAALVIGRRYYGFKEKPPKQLIGINAKGTVKTEHPPVRMALGDYQYYNKLQRWYQPLEKSLDFLSGWRHFRRVNRVSYSVEARLDGRPGMSPDLIQESATLLSAHPAL